MKPAKIVQYMVCRAHSSEGLHKSVNEFIASGWQPIGGIAVGVPDYNYGFTEYNFYQTMVKYEEVKSPRKRKHLRKIKRWLATLRRTK